MIQWLWGTMFAVALYLGFSPTLHAAARIQTKIQILQTADLHSHFLDRDSPMRFGGVARIKHQIDFLKKSNPNTLVLDAGDWSEGSMFFTLGSGEASQRLLESIGYDAIVMGNHDWLVGPQELYDTFVRSRFNIPIVGSNLGLKLVPEAINLKKYIRPYVIKEVGGIKVGIFGLSTFQLIYDSFFSPVQINEPFLTGIAMVHKLRDVEKCDVVIALTHLGIEMDKMVARLVPGIDLIVGGHSHVALKDPYVVGRTPIVHAGKWGQYLGQYEITVETDHSVALTKWQLHQVDSTIPEDGYVKTIVEGFSRDLQKKFGDVIDNRAIYSDVYLKTVDNYGDDPLGNWMVDAIREIGDADVAFNHVHFTSRDIFKGWSSTFDLFNVSPAVFQEKTQKAWTISTFELPGFALKLLLNGLFKTGSGIRVSNAHVVLDYNKALPVEQFLIGGKPVENFKYYKVAGSQGIVESLNWIKTFTGSDLGTRNINDTGVEVWKAVAEALKKISPITVEKAIWQGRVRTKQPDLMAPAEQVFLYGPKNKKRLRVQLINAGLLPTKLPQIEVWINRWPEHRLEETWDQLPHVQPSNAEGVMSLGPSQSVYYDIPWDNAANLAPGTYPVMITIPIAEGETETRNNIVETFVELTAN